MTVSEMLDELADYYAQVDLLNLQKQEMLDAVKIPSEVQAIHDEGVRRKQQIDTDCRARLEILEAEKAELLAGIVVPAEVLAIFREVEEKRRAIEAEINRKAADARADAARRQAQIDGEFTSKVADVYAGVEQRRREINVEFAGKASAAEANIEKLRQQIVAATIREGKSIKGKHWQAVYAKGRVSWDTKMLEGLMMVIPHVAEARKEGEPSVSLRRIG